MTKRDSHTPKRCTNTSKTGEELHSLVRQALKESFSNLNISANPEDITANIVQELENGGVLSECHRECKPLRKDVLAEKFLQTYSMDCLTLQKIELQGIGNGLNIYAVSGNASCINIAYESACFLENGQASELVCSWKSQITEDLNLAENYFPRYILDVTCYGCQKQDFQCLNVNKHCYFQDKQLNYYPLRRLDDGECDENGFEIWKADTSMTLSVNGGCDCIRLT